MNSQLLGIASLNGEELLLYLLGRGQGNTDDLSDIKTLDQLVRTHMSLGTSCLPSAVLQQLGELESTADQLTIIKRTIEIAGLLLDIKDEMIPFFRTGNAVTTVVDLLDCVLSLRLRKTSSQEDWLEACTACFMFVDMTICTNGVPWVVEAFENGFLSALLKATDELKRIRGLGDLVRGLNRIIGEIIETLTEYMSNYSVITALSTIKGRRNAARALRAQQSGPLKDKWVALFKLINERCTIQGLFSARFRNVPFRCANVECSTELYRRNMLRCAGCLCIFYCSQPCQRRAWKYGDHKAKCNNNIPHNNASLKGNFTWGSRDINFLPILCNAWVVKNLFFISAQARKKFPSLPAHEISFSIDFKAQSPEVEILHIDEAIRILPQYRNMIKDVAYTKAFICISTHASSADHSLPPRLETCFRHASFLKCDVLYDLLEVLRQPNPDPGKHNECLEAAKQCCQSFANLINEISSDFQSFLEDSSRRRWSSWNAKDIVCRSSETGGMDWLFI